MRSVSLLNVSHLRRLLVAMAIGLGIWLGPKEKAVYQAFDRREAGRAIWTAKWELLLPVVT